MTTLYIDDISEDGAVAITTNLLSLAHNLAAFNIPERKGQSPVFLAGKYLCILLPAPSPYLDILELHSNPMLADMLLNDSGLTPSFKKKLTKIIEIYNRHYDDNKDKVVLVMGQPSSGVA